MLAVFTFFSFIVHELSTMICSLRFSFTFTFTLLLHRHKRVQRLPWFEVQHDTLVTTHHSCSCSSNSSGIPGCSKNMVKAVHAYTRCVQEWSELDYLWSQEELHSMMKTKRGRIPSIGRSPFMSRHRALYRK